MRILKNTRLGWPKHGKYLRFMLRSSSSMVTGAGTSKDTSVSAMETEEKDMNIKQTKFHRH